MASMIPPIIQQFVPQQRRIQPDFSPVNVQPAVPTQTQQAIQNLPLPNINDPAYQHHGLRKVLDAVASGYLGILGGPAAGIMAHDKLAHSGYTQAMGQYQNRLAQLTGQENIEQEQYNRGLESARLGVQRGTAQVGAEYKTSQEQTAATRASAAKEQADTAANRAGTYDKNIQSLIQRRKDLTNKIPDRLKEAIDFSKLSEDEQDSVADAVLKLHPTKPEKSIDEIKSEAKARAEGTIEGGGTPGSLAATTAKTKAVEEVKGGPAADQETVDYWTRQILNDSKNYSELSKLTNRTLQKQVGDNLAKHGVNIQQLDTITRDVATLAKTALPHVNKILNEIIPKNEDKLGPVVGRWNDFMTGKVGVGPDFITLRDNVNLLLTNMGRIHGGTRGGGSKFMLDHFKSMADSGKMDVPTLRGALSVFKDWLEGYYSLVNTGDTEFNKKKPYGDVEVIR